jgi:hypothetical protein
MRAFDPVEDGIKDVLSDLPWLVSGNRSGGVYTGLD